MLTDEEIDELYVATPQDPDGNDFVIFARAIEAAVAVMPASVRQAMAPKPTTEPTLTLGTISNRLCFSVTSVFLASLGFEAITVKASKLFHEEDFPAICEAIKTHISEVQDQFEPATA